MDNNVLATLKVRTSDQNEKSVTLKDGQSLKIGRDSSNDIVLDDLAVSRMHATFSASVNGLVIADLQSSNGTFVNGEQIISLRDLASNDIVDIGSTKFAVEIHSDKAADSLSASFSSRAMTAQLKPVSVTVIIATVSNYKRMSDEVPGGDLNSMFQSWTRRVTAAVEELGGVVDKCIGPSVVALWTGTEAPELALKAIQASVRIKNLSQSLAEGGTWKHQSSHPWKATVVLSSGRGLTGVVGSNGGTHKKGFAILGDPINLAFRLEELVGKLGEDLIVPQSTAELVKDRVQLEKVIKVKIKGQESETQVYSLIS